MTPQMEVEDGDATVGAGSATRLGHPLRAASSAVRRRKKYAKIALGQSWSSKRLMDRMLVASSGSGAVRRTRTYPNSTSVSARTAVLAPTRQGPAGAGP